MVDFKKSRILFDPIDEPNAEEGSTGAGTLVDNDLPGFDPNTVLAPKQASQEEEQAKEVTDAYAEEWKRLLETDEEPK
jgi:hypothetical protein